MKVLEFIQIEKFEDNIEKYGWNENTCECCGKQLKDKSNAVQTIEGPEVIPANITEEQLDEMGLVSQGIFYLGSTCIKKYPKEYRLKFA
tara:strand:- start:860 stop:1126 length:267 start_codon:yes stop_codon:yes gene_type:complete